MSRIRQAISEIDQAKRAKEKENWQAKQVKEEADRKIKAEESKPQKVQLDAKPFEALMVALTELSGKLDKVIDAVGDAARDAIGKDSAKEAPDLLPMLQAHTAAVEKLASAVTALKAFVALPLPKEQRFEILRDEDGLATELVKVTRYDA